MNENSTPPLKRDWQVGLALFALTALIGGAFTVCWGTPMFWQIKYGPAAMLALGKGYFNPDINAVPALKDFFTLHTAVLDVRALPAMIPPLPEFDPMQLLYLYTQLAIAAVWSVTGVSWPALSILFALLYGLTALAAYGLFRLLMRRSLAIAFTLVFCTSALQLAYLQWLRDYGKVPLIFGLVFLLGILVARPWKTRPLLGLATAYGVIAGIGLGCRDDMMVMLPLFPVALLCFAPGPWKSVYKPKLGAIALMFFAFLLSAAPILFFRAQIGACTGDHVYLGLLDRCTGRLGVGGAPYHFGGPYSDTLMIHVTQNYAQRVLGWAQAPAWYSLDYDRAGTTLLKDLLNHFPADFATRACAAVWRVLDGFLPTQPNPAPGKLLNPSFAVFFHIHYTLLKALACFGRYQVLAALLVLAARNWRHGLLALMLGLYLLGLSAVQFNLRHHVHWAIVGLLATGYLSEQTLQWIAQARNGQYLSPRNEWRQWAKGPVAMVIVTLLLIPSSLWILRVSQQGRVEQLLGAYDQLPVRPLQPATKPTGKGLTQLSIPAFAQMETVPPDRQTWPAHTALLALDFEGPLEETPLRIQYTPEVAGSDHPGTDLSWTVKTPALRSGEQIRAYIPVYYASYSRFDGIVLPENAATNLRAVQGVDDESALPPLLVFAMLRPDWKAQPLYVTITSP